MKDGNHIQELKYFSISENEWQFAPDLIHPRCDHGIGRIEDHIFIMMESQNQLKDFQNYEERVEGDFTNE